MKQKIQFDIRSILIVIFFVSIALAIFSQWDSIVSSILVTVLLANFAGAVTALIVTFVLRFPRDGGFRDREIDNECGTDLRAVNERTQPGGLCHNPIVAQATSAGDEQA